MRFTIRSRKNIAFIVGLIILVGAFVFTVLFAPESVAAIWPWFVSGLIFLIAVYIGGNVWKDFVKSKHFNAELMNKD